MKKTVYFDTTIPSYLFDDRKEIKTFIDLSKIWWEKESRNYDIWISEETLAELAEEEYPNKPAILEFISQFQVLSPTEEKDDF